MTYSDIADMSSEMGKSFISLRSSISHLISEGDKVSARLTYYIQTVENP